MLTVTTLSVLALVLPVLAVPTKKEMFRQSFFKRQGEAASADLTVVKVSVPHSLPLPVAAPLRLLSSSAIPHLRSRRNVS